MASRITCITKPNAHSSHEHITNVGGVRSNGGGFYITREECANDIDNRKDTYYVEVGKSRIDVQTYTRGGTKYIKTRNDDTQKDNLLSLKQC